MPEFPFQPIDFASNNNAPLIKVIGAGGGGSNAVNRMFRTPIPGVDYVVVNTDSQALQRCGRADARPGWRASHPGASALAATPRPVGSPRRRVEST